MAHRLAHVSALIVDPDPQFQASLKADPGFAGLSPILSSGGDEVLGHLSDTSKFFSGIFVSATVAWPCALPLIKLAREKRPGTPIYILYRDFAPFSDNEVSRLAVEAMIAKPLTVNAIQKLVFPTGAAPVIPTPKNQVPVSADLDPAFAAVPIEEFLAGRRAHFDIYIRTPGGKYAAISHARETLDPEKVLKYIENGATHLYLRKESIARCLSYCDQLGKNLLALPGVPTEIKFLQNASLGRDFLDAAKSQSSLESFNVDYGVSFLGGLFNMVRQSKGGDQKDLMKAYFSNAESIEHAVGVSFICAVLAKPLGIDAPKVFKQLGLASLFHDLGLSRLDASLSHEDETRMTPEQRSTYRKHPSEGANLVEKIPGVEAVAVQAIKQHHARRDNTGFPSDISAGDIQLFAEMIGIADEYTKLLLKKKANPNLNIKDSMEPCYNGFSLKVVEAFKVSVLAMT